MSILGVSTLITVGIFAIILACVSYRRIRRYKREIEMAKIQCKFMEEEIRIHRNTLKACRSMTAITNKADKSQQSNSKAKKQRDKQLLQ